jgi:hypothetical protein
MEPNALVLGMVGAVGCVAVAVFWVAFTVGACVLAKRSDRAMGIDLEE